MCIKKQGKDNNNDEALASTIKQTTHQRKGGMKNKERERERERERAPKSGSRSVQKPKRVQRNKLCFINHKKYIGKEYKGRETFKSHKLSKSPHCNNEGHTPK
jgi:hypothetical protein